MKKNTHHRSPRQSQQQSQPRTAGTGRHLDSSARDQHSDELTADQTRLDQIGFLLGRAYYSYIGFLQAHLDREGLGEIFKPGMGSLLFALFREDNRTVTSLASELQLAKSTMTGMIARMRDAGLITITPDASDGRSSRLQLTRLAKLLESRCRKLAVTVEAGLLKDFSRDEADRLRAALQQTIATMSNHLEHQPDPGEIS